MGKRNDFGFLSLSSSFLVFEFFSLLLLKALLKRRQRQKKGERRVLLSLFVANKNIFENISQRAKKKKKSILS